MQPVCLLQKHGLTQASSQAYARDAWDATVLTCFAKPLSGGTFGLKICILFIPGFDRGFQAPEADLNLELCSLTAISKEPS